MKISFTSKIRQKFQDLVMHILRQAYSEPCETCEIEYLAEIVHG